MNAARFYRSLSLRVALLHSTNRIDTEEVDGSNPFGPTIIPKNLEPQRF